MTVYEIENRVDRAIKESREIVEMIEKIEKSIAVLEEDNSRLTEERRRLAELYGLVLDKSVDLRHGTQCECKCGAVQTK